MDLLKKKNELEQMLEEFLSSPNEHHEKLNDFAWDMIDYFNTAEELPQEQSFEKTFWYAIWNIQHLCDPEHIQDGVATKELRECLLYLNGTKELPEKFSGRRP